MQPPLTHAECIALRAAAEAVQSRLDEPSGPAWFDLMIRVRRGGSPLSLPSFRASLAVAVAKLDRACDGPILKP